MSKKDATLRILEADQGIESPEVKKLKEQLKNEANQKNGFKIKFASAEKQVQELKNRVNSESSMKSQYKSKLKTAREEIESLQQEIGKNKPGNMDSDQAESKRFENKQLKNENAELVKDIKRLEKEKEELKSNKTTALVAEVAVTDIPEVQSILAETGKNVEKLKEENISLEKNNSKLKGLIIERNETIEGLVAQKIKFMDKKEKMEAENEDQSNRIKDMEDDVKYLREQRKETVDAFDIAEENCQDLVSKNMELKDAIAGMAIEIFGRHE